MTGTSIDVDVAVVGAGTAGTQAALQLALTGRRVVLLDRRPAHKGGARWCNGVVPWQFERAGLPLPAEPELRHTGGPVHMISPSGRHRIHLAASPIWDVDMRLLGERLWAAATDAGVDIRWDVDDLHVRLDRGRPVELTATCGGAPLRIAAALFVDGSGRTGVLRGAVPALARWCPPARPDDLCSAQHLILDVADRDGAERFLADVGARPGEAVNWVGPAGGYSVEVITVSAELDEVSVLTGTLADGRSGTGPDMMKRIRAERPWIGAPRFGGGALIPLHRTYDRLAAPGIALVGDAAGQVMAAHGSGVGYGLIAGRVLAEATTGAADPGSVDALWAYQARYLREFGPSLGAYDAFRRMSVALGRDGVEQLFATGVFSPEMVEPGLHQRLAPPDPRLVVRQARALATHPGLGRVVAPALIRAGIAQVLYRTYPTRPSERALRAWSRTARLLLGA